MVLTYFLFITSQLRIDANCLKSFTLKPPPEKGSFRLRAGLFTVVSADYNFDQWVIEAQRLLKDYGCDWNTNRPGATSTSGRSLVSARAGHENHENGRYKISNYCTWRDTSFLLPEDHDDYLDKKYEEFDSGGFCLGVREANPGDLRTTFAVDPKYLIWNQIKDCSIRRNFNHDGKCKYFYITAPYDNEKDMFNIFHQQDDHFYSPSCCVVANDNANIPGVDNGLTMCKCEEQDINIIQGKAVIKKGLLGRFKKLFH